MNPIPFPVGSTRILVVDDEKPVREILEYTLGNDGYQVVTAGSGIEALNLAKMMRFDLVIIDMIMPGKEGIETIMELRALSPDIRIIAMSGGLPGATGDFLPLAKTLGASATLRKPFDRAAFMDTVRETIAPPRRRAVC